MKAIYNTSNGRVRQLVNETQNFDKIFAGYTDVSWCEIDTSDIPVIGGWHINTETQEIEVT